MKMELQIKKLARVLEKSEFCGRIFGEENDKARVSYRELLINILIDEVGKKKENVEQIIKYFSYIMWRILDVDLYG